jgi:hypothetical protein
MGAIRDKVEDTREIPLTPDVAQLLASLPRRNERVFSSSTSASGCLTEWLEVPVGVVGQIQGKKLSATAEKHYTVLPLALHHVRINAWFLKRAGLCLMPKPHRENFVWSMPLEQVI